MKGELNILNSIDTIEDSRIIAALTQNLDSLIPLIRECRTAESAEKISKEDLTALHLTLVLATEVSRRYAEILKFFQIGLESTALAVTAEEVEDPIESATIHDFAAYKERKGIC